MPAARPTARLVGLDVARCVALVGMIAVHTIDERTPSGELSWTHWVAGGRASALFAVLAGVALALVTDRPGGRSPRSLLAVLVRAAMVASLGLFLGGLDSGLAVILTYYGLLFVVGLPFVALGPRALLLLAGGWAVVAPVVSHVLRARPEVPPRSFEVPSFASLAEPLDLLADLTLTGYYPVLPWLAYLLLGMGIARLDLRDRAVAGRLVVGGLAAAVGAAVVSRVLVTAPSVREALVRDYPTGMGADEVIEQARGGLFGVTPSPGPWQWLLLDAPHSATPFDLVATGGSAALVIGLCLLLADALRGWALRGLAVLTGAGAMTLTLYSLHVLLRTPDLWPPDDGPEAFRWHVLVVLWTGAVFAALSVRGPLEWLVRRVTGAVAGS
ncbi:heparan-alpha-glucosaminide N-acetyltransferase domain-containing protein [Nocardioides nanhaiensis]|uniref:Heparan-alpha-glucosaminide N-acetyltransferase domain-containing protein n=1 Tax=Nocardioides nanhaiensis TaxID=1476871 RepID=A0ABP8W0D3_9ACTN